MKNNDSIELTEFQKQIILAGLLGSMCIPPQHFGSNPHIQFAHNIKEKDYFDFKMEMLKNIMGNSVSCNCNTYRTQSLSVQCLKPLYNLTYAVGKKVVTQLWVDSMTNPITLAIFFMDSGTVTNGGKSIAFGMGDSSNEECLIVQKWLYDKWGVKSQIYFREGSFKPGSEGISRRTIVLTTKDSINILVGHINPHLVPSMNLKINKLLPHYRGLARPPCLVTTPTTKVVGF